MKLRILILLLLPLALILSGCDGEAFAGMIDDIAFYSYALTAEQLKAHAFPSLPVPSGDGVPEPSTWALMLLGAAGLLYWRKRK